MRWAEKCPRAPAGNAGEDRHERAHYSTSRTTCNLYGVRIFDRLPQGCPLAMPSAAAAVDALRNRAYSRLAPYHDADADLPGGLDDLDRCETCSVCIARAMAQPRVRRLRRLAAGRARRV